ncbi:glyoxalase superfamily protein [Aeromonas veronii]
MSDQIKTAKAQADKMSARLKQLGVEIKRTQCLEAIAAINNHPSWNHFCAAVGSVPEGAAPLVAEQTMNRYIVGGLLGAQWSPHVRKVFFDAISAGHQPIYVELKSSESKPLRVPAGISVGKIDVRFDWDGNVASTQGAITNPEMALTAIGGPLHICLDYDRRPDSSTGKDELSSDFLDMIQNLNGSQKKVGNALAKALEQIADFLSVYCKSLPSPLVIIDDSRTAVSDMTSLAMIFNTAIEKKSLQLTERLMASAPLIDRLTSLAPSVLFSCSEGFSHVVGPRLKIASFYVTEMPCTTAFDTDLLRSIKITFRALSHGAEANEKRNTIDLLITVCELAGFCFGNQKELMDHLMTFTNWDVEFSRLVMMDHKLVSVRKSELVYTLPIIDSDPKFYEEASSGLIMAVGDWVEPLIKILRGRVISQ